MSPRASLRSQPPFTGETAGPPGIAVGASARWGSLRISHFRVLRPSYRGSIFPTRPLHLPGGSYTSCRSSGGGYMKYEYRDWPSVPFPTCLNIPPTLLAAATVMGSRLIRPVLFQFIFVRARISSSSFLSPEHVASN